MGVYSNSSSSSNTVLRWRFVSYRYCSTYDEGVEKRDSVGLLEAYRLTTDLLLYVQARTNLCKLLISSTSSALVCSSLLLSTSRKQWISSLYAQECCDCLCSTILIITIIEASLSPSSCCKAPGPSSHYISSMPGSSHSHPLEPPRVRTRYRTFAGLHRPRA